MISSVSGGNSGATSFLLLRRINGLISWRRRNSIRLSPCLMGLMNCLVNAFSFPKSSGWRKWNCAHRSFSEFSIGVPVSTSRWWLRSWMAHRKVSESLFFIFWLSSSTMYSKLYWRRISILFRIVPYDMNISWKRSKNCSGCPVLK